VKGKESAAIESGMALLWNFTIQCDLKQRSSEVVEVWV
jgi:hypothetical protein